MATSLREAPAKKSFKSFVNSAASGAGAETRSEAEGVGALCPSAVSEKIPQMTQLQIADFKLQIVKIGLLRTS